MDRSEYWRIRSRRLDTGRANTLYNYSVLIFGLYFHIYTRIAAAILIYRNHVPTDYYLLGYLQGKGKREFISRRDLLFRKTLFGDLFFFCRSCRGSIPRHSALRGVGLESGVIVCSLVGFFGWPSWWNRVTCGNHSVTRHY